MIPKIVHYCWFGSNEKDEQSKRFIAGWKEILTDYEFIEWNETNFPIEKQCKYVKEAYKLKKYAFVSDVARMYALHTIGGIYIDTDIELFKSFDPFLTNTSFLGFEFENNPGTAVIGSTKGVSWINTMLQYYKNTHYISFTGSLSTTNVVILRNFIANNKVNLTGKSILIFNELLIYPIDYFCAKDYISGEIKKTSNTVAIHHYAGSWGSKKKRNIFSKILFRLNNVFIRVLNQF